MNTIKFSGENNWDAIINSNSLDIEEEQNFENFIKDLHYSKDEKLEILEYLFGMWQRENGFDSQKEDTK